jgi:hypothetical protein
MDLKMSLNDMANLKSGPYSMFKKRSQNNDFMCFSEPGGKIRLFLNCSLVSLVTKYTDKKCSGCRFNGTKIKNWPSYLAVWMTGPSLVTPVDCGTFAF